MSNSSTLRFKVSRDDLLEAVTTAGRCADRKSGTSPILTHLCFVALSESEVEVTGTDLQRSARVKFEATGASGAGVLPADKLLQIARALPAGGSVDFRPDTKGERTAISSGTSRFVLNALPREEYPLVEDEYFEAAMAAPDGLAAAIETTSCAVAKNDVRHYLNGLLFDFQDTRLVLVSTDGHRLMKSELPLDAAIFEDRRQFIVPGEALGQIAQLASVEGCRLQISDNMIRVDAGNVSYTSKMIDGSFPNYESVIPNAAANITAPRAALAETIERVGIVSAGDRVRKVSLEFGEGEVTVKSSTAEVGEAVESLDADIHASVTASFNPQYLIETLNALGGDEARISIAGGLSAAVFTDDSGQVGVVMPLRA